MTEDLVGTLRDQTASVAKVVSAVRPDLLTKPTPCAGFDVRALLNHMCLGNDFCAKAVEGVEGAAPEYERDFLGGDHVAAYERSRDELLRALGAPGALERTVLFPGMEVTGEFAANFAILEAVVHRWDLARGVDTDPQIDPAVAGSALAFARTIVIDDLRAASPEAATRTVPFGPVVAVPDDAPEIDRLVAFLGRTP